MIRKVMINVLLINTDNRVTLIDAKSMDLVPDNMSDVSIVKRAKALMGWTNKTCRRVGTLQKGHSWVLLETVNHVNDFNLIITIKHTKPTSP